MLTSSTFTAWVRGISGRLKSDYSISSEITYNNFPWLEPSEKQRDVIELASAASYKCKGRLPRLKPGRSQQCSFDAGSLA